MVHRLPVAAPAAACRIKQTAWSAGSAFQVTTSSALVVLSQSRCLVPTRAAATASSTRWKTRQGNDSYAREAKLAGLKSRAAFKLLEIDDKYRLFRKRDTVVDLGYAPGSWSQVAVNRTSPGGRVVGIDVIPAQPPRGVSTLQGDFLSPDIREELRRYVSDPARGRPRVQQQLVTQDVAGAQDEGATQEDLDAENKSILEREEAQGHGKDVQNPRATRLTAQRQLDEAEGRVVDVVLSDMMMNTSGMAFRDHAGSMDLCLAALDFSYHTLATGGHFLCKFYQGAEDHALEMRLRSLFEKVHRIKPDSSRKESKETYLVGLRRKAGVVKGAVLGED